MLKRHSLSLAIMLSSLSLVACNSNDDDNVNLPSKAVTTTTITVTPSLGKILNGRVALKNAKTGAILAPTQTLTPTSNGTAKFTVPVSKLADPVLAEVLPTAAGIVEYFDEALEANKTITVPAADIAKPILRAAASVTANANIGVTALTEAAVQQAAKQASGLIAQNINNANVAVKNALNLKFDITQAPIVVGYGEFDKLVNAALDTQRRAYATYLATLAKEAQRIDSASATPAYHMARAFADDFSHDGVFNAIGSKALEINYNNAFLTDWFKWVENFYASFTGLGNLVAFNRWYYGFNITDKNSVTTYPDAVPIRTVDGVEEYACSGEGRIKSSQGASIYMDFVNQRGSNMNIYWLNANGSRVTYKTNLLNNQTHNQQTFVTHPWLVTDNTGTCVAIYRPVTATKKTITFKADGVMIGSGTIAQPTTCTTGVETTFATSVGNAPYTNGQKVCFSATTSSLGFDNKTLTSPVKNTVVQAPYSAYSFKDGSYSYEVVFNNNALYEINLSSTSFLGQFTPLVSTPVVETCASKNLAVASLSSIADYNGDYKENGTLVFNLNTATAKATVKGTEGNISEVCGPTVLNNGTNHVLITDKGSVTLFKTTAGVYSAEGKEFADTTKVFYGQKDSAVMTNLAASGTATGTITNVQYNKDGTATGGKGEVRSKVYTFSGDLSGSYTLKIKDTTQNLRYDINGTNGKPSSVNLYASENSNTPLFVYTCDDSTCLSGVSLMQGSAGTTVKFTDMKMRGIYQAQYDAIINGQSTLTANTVCSSTGHDTKLGFTNAPSDFCGFSYTYGTSTAISSPNIYTFKDATDPMANAKVTVLNGSVQSFQLENSKYGYACGVGQMPACVGITIQNDTSTGIEFKFTNVQVANVDSTKQGMVINSGLLMHKKSTVTPPLTGSCVGNTNPYGCLTITGTNAPASIYEYKGADAPLFQSAAANTGGVTYAAQALTGGNLITNGMTVGYQKIVGSTQSTTYTFFEYNSNFAIVKSVTMKCRDANNDCAGLTVNAVDKIVTFNNVIMTDTNGTGAQLTFNGVLKY